MEQFQILVKLIKHFTPLFFFENFSRIVGSTYVYDTRQRRHVPYLLHGWKKTTNTWRRRSRGSDKWRWTDGEGSDEVMSALTSTSTGVTKLLKHQFLQRIVDVEISFNLRQEGFLVLTLLQYYFKGCPIISVTDIKHNCVILVRSLIVYPTPWL